MVLAHEVILRMKRINVCETLRTGLEHSNYSIPVCCCWVTLVIVRFLVTICASISEVATVVKLQ